VVGENGLERRFGRATWLFLRALGLVYLIAFWSLGGQILGLIGHDGVLPADRFLAEAGALPGPAKYWELPTLAWLAVSDAALVTFCLVGGVLALLLVGGLLPIVVLPLLWLIYLSLSVVCGEFLAYQWDALLLEAGFLATFVAPATIRERFRQPAEPPRPARWLLLWLLFRLMAGSGLIKLASGDPTWRNLTALGHHFETQPIPTPAAWYAHALPPWALEGATLAVLALEIGAPFLILGTRRARAAGFLLIAGLQALIAFTGNYAFFNLLTVALALLLLDDATLDRPWRAVAGRASLAPLGGAASVPAGMLRARRWLLAAVAVVVVPVSAYRFAATLGLELPGAAAIRPLANAVAPFRSVNGYGLFAVMTTTRPEIVIEGTADGTAWLEYEFKYKPGDPRRPPPWVAPHQPRLDWHMWFAALGEFEREWWFQELCRRLLEANGEVLSLLARDPFDGRPPRQLRAVLYRYRFADVSGRRAGAWWTRERLGEYSAVLAIDDTR
jgi:hypothetical protein